MTEAARHLIKLQVFYDGQHSYSFNYEGQVKVFRGDEVSLAKFLQSFKAKDNHTNPRSSRGERYIDIAKEITDGTDNIIYAWSNDLANVFNKHESIEEATIKNPDVFIFKSEDIMNLFISTLKKVKFGFTVEGKKVFVEPDKILGNFTDFEIFFDKYADDFTMYSSDEYKFLLSRGEKFESKESFMRLISKYKEFKKSQEHVSFESDGPTIDNSDGKLLDDLFTLIDGQPGWSIKSKGHYENNKGSYIKIKGNFLELNVNGSFKFALPYIKNTKFKILPDSNIKILFDGNGLVGEFIL